jgi:hypothetical protein
MPWILTMFFQDAPYEINEGKKCDNGKDIKLANLGKIRPWALTG